MGTFSQKAKFKRKRPGCALSYDGSNLSNSPAALLSGTEGESMRIRVLGEVVDALKKDISDIPELRVA